jgi:hypothetical protein
MRFVVPGYHRLKMHAVGKLLCFHMTSLRPQTVKYSHKIYTLRQSNWGLNRLKKFDSFVQPKVLLTVPIKKQTIHVKHFPLNIVAPALDTLGVLSVMRICSRTWIWLACVAPANNNSICESIVKRDKGTRDVRRCARRYPSAGYPHTWAWLQLQCPF